MQEPTQWQLLWSQITWGLASHATTILLVLTGTLVIGLGPIGRGLGNLLSGRKIQPPSDPVDAHTLDALSEQAERLDFIERAVLGIRDGNPQVDSHKEPRAMTPV